MDQDITQFCELTGADTNVAAYYLEAHEYDLQRSIDAYLDHAPTAAPSSHSTFAPGHGASDAPSAPPASAATAAHPMSTTAQQTTMDNDDDLLRAIRASLGVEGQQQSEEGGGGGRQRTQRGVNDDVEVVDVSHSDDLDAPAAASGSAHAAQQHVVANGDDGDDEDMPSLGRAGTSTQGVEDFDGVHVYGERLEPGWRRREKREQRRSRAGMQHDAEQLGANGVPDLPDDIDVREARMLEAALLGVPYEGVLPDFSSRPYNDVAMASPPSEAVLNDRMLKQEQDAAYYESLRADREKRDEEQKRAREAREAEAQAREAAVMEARRQQESERALQAIIDDKQRRLPPEPSESTEECVSVAVRLPNGSRISRRFRRSDALQAVFDFVDVQQHGSTDTSDIRPGNYNLVMQFPRKTFVEDTQETLEQAGLSSKQESLFVSLKG